MLPGKDIREITTSLLEKMLDDDSGLSPYCMGRILRGAGGGNSILFRGKLPDLDIEMHPGGQPLYYYIISVE